MYRAKRFSDKDFMKYYEKRVSKVIERYHLNGKKLLLAISGGKDSVAASTVLGNLGVGVDLFFIDLGISGFSSESRKIIELVAKKNNQDLIIYDLKKEEGFTIEDIAGRYRNVCSYCGVVKRYIINKYAYENGYDYIITGHNLDDELALTFINLYSLNLEQFMRTGPFIRTEGKLVGRVKLLYYLTEKENMIYVIVNRMPFVRSFCPFRNVSTQAKVKKWLNRGEEMLPDLKRNLLKALNKLKKDVEEVKVKLNECEICGYPTTSKICRYCRIKNSILESN